MTHRPARLVMLVFFVCSLGVLGYAQAQPPDRDLRPHVQTIGGLAFDPDTRRGIVPIPDGIAPSAPTGTAETPITPAPATFTYLIVRWRATASEPHLVLFEVRASEDGQTWTEWGHIHESEDLVDPEGDPGIHWSGTIYTGPANFWQLRVTLVTASDGSVPVLHEVQVHTVDSRGVDPAPESPPGATPAGILAQPAFVSRAAWGGNTVLNESIAPIYYRADHLVLHHTADANSLRSGEASWADRVRAIWSFHTYSRGWGDVGYNWLVAPNGVIYEGRNGSAHQNEDAVGMHDAANYGSMGVAMIGTFGPGVASVEPIMPPAAAQDAAVRLFAWKASQRGIDPFGSSFYYGCSRSSACYPYVPGSIVRNIAGHREVRQGTSCPGELTMGILDAIRARVHDALAGEPPPPPPPPPPTPTPVPVLEQAELIDVQYIGAPVEDGGVIQVRFTIRNTGNVTLGTQAPEPGRVDNILPGHVYDESECFIGDGDPGSYPAFPKDPDGRRLRVTLGGTEGGTGLGADCAGNHGGNPWRWGIGSPLQPGETRTVVGYVRFHNRTASTRAITLLPNLVYENVQYFPSRAGMTEIAVTPERHAPQVSATDENRMPLAAVYRLAPTPQDLLYRATDPAAAQEREFLGTFAWDGSAQQWGDGGPVGQTDHFVVAQVRPFLAPQDGSYTFELTTDDASWLWVDGQLVVANAGLHGAASVSGSIPLSAGVHTLAVKYVEYVGGAYARYSWRPAGLRTYGPIPVVQTITAPQRGTVYGAGQQIALVADDLGGSGTREIQYSIDGGSGQYQSGSMLILSLGHGSHSISYRATDHGGAQSPEQRISIQVDAQAPQTTLSASTRSDGIIQLTWSSSPDAQLFELQVFDEMDGSWRSLSRTARYRLAFFGTPGHVYWFRIRGWDGLNWEDFQEQQGPPQTVPVDARFWKTRLSLIGN